MTGTRGLVVGRSRWPACQLLPVHLRCASISLVLLQRNISHPPELNQAEPKLNKLTRGCHAHAHSPTHEPPNTPPHTHSLTLTHTHTHTHTHPHTHRLASYAAIGKRDPLYATCEAGAGGDGAKAKACLAEWAVKREKIVAQLQVCVLGVKP